MVNPAIIRQSAEQRFAAELNLLTEHDQANARPQGGQAGADAGGRAGNRQVHAV